MKRILSIILSIAMIIGLAVTVPGKSVDAATVPTVTYMTHVQGKGDTSWVSDGQSSGTVGESKRLEAIKIKVSGVSNLGITYRVHAQTYGWMTWASDGNLGGTSGESKRLEAIQIKLTGANASKYDVYYRVHAQNYGWLGWAKNGESSGTSGQSKRLESIEIKIVAKGAAAPGSTSYKYIEYGKSSTNTNASAGMVNYMTHVQTYGNQAWVSDGSLSGTYGESKRLEAIYLKLGNTGYTGGITYQTQVQKYGWLGFVSDGAMSGTSGESKRLEAIQIKLTGNVANYYDVYYRVHAQTYGWLGWAKNGASAGTVGLSKRLEGIQVVLLPKGSAAPLGSSMAPCVEAQSSSDSSDNSSSSSDDSSSSYNPYAWITADARTDEQLQQEFLNIYNAYRVQNGLPEVTMDATLNKGAMIRAEEFGKNTSLAHTRPDGTKWQTVFIGTEFENHSVGEILTSSFDWYDDGITKYENNSAQDAFNRFKKSPGHNSIMLEFNKTYLYHYTKVGIGIYRKDKTSRNGYYWAIEMY